jgi:hypothetical protein
LYIWNNPKSRYEKFILVLQNRFCEYCGKVYSNINYKWCNPCRINKLKQDFKNWTSGNEKIDELIQEMQLKINTMNDIIFEWISYNQFHNIKEIHKDDSVTLYSAIWIDGPLEYDLDKMEWERVPNKEVTLKCLYNSQNNTNEFINKVNTFDFCIIELLFFVIIIFYFIHFNRLSHIF